MEEPLQQGEIDALSADADRFLAELDEETYLHFAGLKDTYELAPIYARHEELTKLETALSVGASVDGNRNTRELWRFACEGYLGNFVRAEAERVGALVDGDAGGRVRDVDERGVGAVRVGERVLHLPGDVDELRLPVGLEGELLHG